MKIRIPDFSKTRVLVVGDLMLDRYWQGQANRISPEAPVPVVNVEGMQERPGGAANVALNVVALGARCTLVGAVGKDDEGRLLRDKLQAAGVECQFVELEDWATPVKLRVVSQQQQLIRLDFERPLAESVFEQISAGVEAALGNCDAMILEDYDKGCVLNPAELIGLARKAEVPVVVDPKQKVLKAYQGASVIKPNLSEFQASVGVCENLVELEQAAGEIVKSCDLQALVVTRGADGMLLTERDGKHLSIPSRAVDVHDVTGAGDTVAAVLGAMQAIGESLEASTILANVAASIVVAKSGTASVSLPEIAQTLSDGIHADRGILDEESLKQQVLSARARGERIVFTNGCFDILHAGHISYLEEARQLGDRLIVAVNSDESVKVLKGLGRPVNTLSARMRVLSGLSAVDWVVSFSEDTPEALLELLQPELLVKGGDYGIEGVVGAEIVQAYGGKVEVLGLVEGQSTTKILERVRS